MTTTHIALQASLQTLATDVINRARAHSIHLSTVESCTGGLITATLTDISGASDCVLGGIVSYANDLKINLAGVSQTTLEDFGAVSEETALEMAKGGQLATHANITVAVTGIAGPSGGSAEKPVGLVWFGISSDHSLHAAQHFFKGTRAEIRTQAVEHALKLILSELKKF